MADQWYGGQSNSGERWNVNLPAVVGVVFVFLLGVVIWVIATSGGDDEIQSIDTAVPTLATTSTVATTVPAVTTPQPMPVTTPAVVATVPPTVPATVPPTPAPTAPPPPPPAPTAAPPPTAATTTTIGPAPTAAPGNGDLGVPGHPIQRPPCQGGYITVLASAVGNEATPSALDAVLDRYSGSNYLRTDQTCASLTPSVDGEPIYVVYLGPYTVDAEACQARAQGPNGAYVRRLSNDLPPSHTVTCA